MDPQELEQEIKNMKKMDHPHILKMFEYFEDYNNVYLILELCEGGELMKVIEDTYTKSRGKKRLTEGWIAGLYAQVLEAVSYCHSHGLIHKDIKAENIMLLNKDKTTKNPFDAPPHVVLIDFGLAEAFDPDRPFVSRHVAGTPYTMAPEVWNATLSRSNTFGLKCDVYSLGCVLFHLFCGEVHAVSVREINGIFRMLDHEKQGIISKQTCVTGLVKLGIPQSTAARAVEAMDLDGDGRIDYTELIAGILCFYDTHLDGRLWKAFSKLDLNGDGKLDRHEIRKLLQSGEVSQMGLVPAQMEIDAIIQEMDTDRDGYALLAGAVIVKWP
ncbi:calcium-dependent protein kinase, putative [Perkinsus marinus ATCC 50983]|uniref:Calcium-dependent protein kinase, putative n=1 Tax=Perkinsus marinus (strain ATCC 50983 / TXsc) TaxID=423536 RepID=C5L7Y3_PERM5|nr:calcium-dependent protein kinase, putative [Perkinsus marinus ATCC 50983]EER07163.1 calcium-dependent protein kinase, putative [Perkinsus marinus ATCC 50983]|eukprot:XP_002775347.1 calcium-dependent protein kinase, putative [Perkinsus marinus ATCC 50983]